MAENINDYLHYLDTEIERYDRISKDENAKGSIVTAVASAKIGVLKDARNKFCEFFPESTRSLEAKTSSR
jgi:hypothetical protein